MFVVAVLNTVYKIPFCQKAFPKKAAFFDSQEQRWQSLGCSLSRSSVPSYEITGNHSKNHLSGGPGSRPAPNPFSLTCSVEHRPAGGDVYRLTRVLRVICCLRPISCGSREFRITRAGINKCNINSVVDSLWIWLVGFVQLSEMIGLIMTAINQI